MDPYKTRDVYFDFRHSQFLLDASANQRMLGCKVNVRPLNAVSQTKN